MADSEDNDLETALIGSVGELLRWLHGIGVKVHKELTDEKSRSINSLNIDVVRKRMITTYRW